MSKIKVIGTMPGYELANRVYDKNGVSPKIMECVKIKQATKKGYIDCKIGGIADLSYPTSKTRRGRVINNGEVSPTIMANDTPNVIEKFTYEIDGNQYLIRIRKLTPRECWRLMGFSDDAFDRAAEVNSNSQLYKQAGNSIVVNVLEEIFKQIFLNE